MELSEQYQQEVRSLLEALRSSGQPVVVFGACRAGWYIIKVLEGYGVPITAVADNDPRKQTSYCGYRVLSPQAVAHEAPSAHIFLGVFNPNTASVIQKQFHQLGFQHVHDSMAACLFTYFVSVAKRSCDHGLLAESIRMLFENYREGSIHYGFTKDNYFVSPYVTGVITQKCTLRCRDCGQLIPYYHKPVHFPVEAVVRDIKQYAKAFDVVPEISLHGGEPFLHPDVGRICREISLIPNIVFINFTTNGTILPPDETLEVLSSCGADIHQSDYGTLSKRQQDLFSACEKHKIYCDIHFVSETEMWSRSAPIVKYNRNSLNNDGIFKQCVSTKVCCQIMNGELHRCPLSMHASFQEIIPKSGDDYVALNDPNTSDAAVVAHIRDFLTRETALVVCDYCDPDNSELVLPAIQLSKASVRSTE